MINRRPSRRRPSKRRLVGRIPGKKRPGRRPGPGTKRRVGFVKRLRHTTRRRRSPMTWAGNIRSIARLRT